MQTRPDETNIPPKSAVLAMLAHLQRSGVPFLPNANPDRAGQLSTLLDIPNESLSPSKTIAPPDRLVAAKPIGSVPGLQAPKSQPLGRLSPAPRVHESLAPPVESYKGPKLPVLQRTQLLEEIAGEVAACRACESLAGGRNRTVPGEGNSAARVCFLGEAPGADEDESGRPFVGRAGQLLTKMIEACTFSRGDVFILNTVKCRPPGNRNPEHQEVENCRGFLERQLEAIQPEYIVCLGLVAAQAILHTKLSVGRLRGQFHAYRESKVLVTYHPSYLLREPEVKKAAWADLQFLLRDMAIELPKK